MVNSDITKPQARLVLVILILIVMMIQIVMYGGFADYCSDLCCDSVTLTSESIKNKVQAA